MQFELLSGTQFHNGGCLLIALAEKRNTANSLPENFIRLALGKQSNGYATRSY
jgi:hypothetical protein